MMLDVEAVNPHFIIAFDTLDDTHFKGLFCLWATGWAATLLGVQYGMRLPRGHR